MYIDNAIHSSSGIQLRIECNEIMKKQGYDEKVGFAKITKAYNLPSKYVIHTVGPFISDKVRDKDIELLKNCYKSCLNILAKNNLETIAFCCISTGEFNFPNEIASKVAIETVKDFVKKFNSIKVIFNVYNNTDYYIYKNNLEIS